MKLLNTLTTLFIAYLALICAAQGSFSVSRASYTASALLVLFSAALAFSTSLSLKRRRRPQPVRCNSRGN